MKRRMKSNEKARHPSSSGCLEKELNLDGFREYLQQIFPNQELESWSGQMRYVFDELVGSGIGTLQEVDSAIQESRLARRAIFKELPEIKESHQGTIPWNLEVLFALELKKPGSMNWLIFPRAWLRIINQYRADGIT